MAGLHLKSASALGTAALVAICLLPAAQAKSFHVLYKFQGGSDGTTPMGGLVEDKDGNLYGTTASGGTSNSGTVFKLSPGGAETVLYSFGFFDGGSPQAGVVRDGAGNLYGTTEEGGGQTCECGAVFKVAPDGTETVLHAFSVSDGAAPTGRLIRRNSDFYGTASGGGDQSCAGGCGVIFKLTPQGNYQVLHGFSGSDGGNPSSRLITHNAGNLYGTTYSGGGSGNCEGGCGVIFRYSDKRGYKVLYTFGGGADGGGPVGSMAKDRAGNLYGTASLGGKCNTCGVVFRLAADATYSVIHSFSGGADGESPFGGLLHTRKGTLFGTTAYGGGDCNCGTVYRIDPDGTETVLHVFAVDEGIDPYSELIDDGRTLYGTSAYGGNGGNGAVFSVKK